MCKNFVGPLQVFYERVLVLCASPRRDKGRTELILPFAANLIDTFSFFDTMTNRVELFVA